MTRQVRRAFRYRFYPTSEQAAELSRKAKGSANRANRAPGWSTRPRGTGGNSS
ncbi:helix-turn-helix domain-containing protein [Streptomyces sp. 3MP-14]|uniref:Helix-turn-helix domain-containing protein n=1 Tax=Streptomyces mimosae TaxID=2586635 RepID=A0A5N6AIS4_9ACTN|nr:helix-turn-helix domain-containing protein [Streptomyces mimosae]KAB8177582.1 helix-turn-helix domain-containing protein [Streptomyces sp. 3MP-14]